MDSGTWEPWQPLSSRQLAILPIHSSACSDSIPCYLLFFSLISERLPSSHGREIKRMVVFVRVWNPNPKVAKGSSRQQGLAGGRGWNSQSWELCMWRPAPILTSCLQPWTPYRYNLKTPLNPIGCTKKLASDVGVSKFQGTWALFPNEPVLEHYSIRALYFGPCLVGKIFEMTSFYIWSTKRRLIIK